jgi:hypothetical protein
MKDKAELAERRRYADKRRVLDAKLSRIIFSSQAAYAAHINSVHHPVVRELVSVSERVNYSSKKFNARRLPIFWELYRE